MSAEAIFRVTQVLRSRLQQAVIAAATPARFSSGRSTIPTRPAPR